MAEERDYDQYASNYTCSNQEEYISDCNYLVVIDNNAYGFSKVNGIEERMSLKALTEGGFKSHSSLQKKKNDDSDDSADFEQGHTLTLEKGYSKNMNTFLAKDLKVGREIKEFLLIVLKEKNKVGKAFYFEKGIISKRSFSDLDALSGGIFILRLEITHTGLKEEV